MHAFDTALPGSANKVGGLPHRSSLLPAPSHFIGSSTAGQLSFQPCCTLLCNIMTTVCYCNILKCAKFIVVVPVDNLPNVETTERLKGL